EMIVVRPARELAPFDGLELAARKFQRPFGPCAGGRETDDRAKQACEDPAPRRAPRPLCKLPTRLHANQCTADRNGSAARARVFLGAVERLCRAGARYHDAGKKRKSFACNLSAGRAFNLFRPLSSILIPAPCPLSVCANVWRVPQVLTISVTDIECRHGQIRTPAAADTGRVPHPAVPLRQGTARLRHHATGQVGLAGCRQNGAGNALRL